MHIHYGFLQCILHINHGHQERNHKHVMQGYFAWKDLIIHWLLELATSKAKVSSSMWNDNVLYQQSLASDQN